MLWAYRSLTGYANAVPYMLTRRHTCTVWRTIRPSISSSAVRDASASHYWSIRYAAILKDAIYVLELKYNHTAENAIKQIKRKRYADAFLTDGRPVWAVGLNFNPTTRTLDDDWQVEQLR